MAGPMGVSLVPRLQHSVALAVHQGKTADEIYEEIIDPESITDEAKAALWLYATVMQEPAAARRQAVDLLESLPPGD